MFDQNLPAWLPAATFGIVMAASVMRGLMLRSRGVEAYGFSYRSSIQQATERFWKLAVALIASAILIGWFAPQWEQALGRPAWASAAATRWLAALLLLGGGLIVLAGQQAMGASWRVGVPSDGPGDLVARGIFRVSRNPVFVGMFAMVVGAFLWSPTFISAAATPLAAAIMSMQVRIEEEALLAKHGDAYLAYSARVPRWVWPIG